MSPYVLPPPAPQFADPSFTAPGAGPVVFEEFSEFVEGSAPRGAAIDSSRAEGNGAEVVFASADEFGSIEESEEASPGAVPAPVEFSEDSAREGVGEVRRSQPAGVDTARGEISEPEEVDSRGQSGLAVADHEAEDEEGEEGLMFRKRRDTFEDMDLTPMVDMMILLLIFFMVTTSKELQKALEMPAPGADSGGAMQAQFNPEQLEDSSIRVRIDDKNVVYIEDDAVGSLRQVLEKLKQQMRETQRYELIVSADPLAFHETVVAVVDAATAAGVQKIRMSGGGGE
jgi:biopolymer transport protein ExbD